jgi:hypothetical protein
MFEKKIIASTNFEICLYLGIIFVKDPHMFFPTLYVLSSRVYLW